MKVKYISKPGVEYETDYPNAHDGDVMCYHCEEIVFDLNVEVFELGYECPECVKSLIGILKQILMNSFGMKNL